MYNELRIIVEDGVYGDIVYAHLNVTLRVKANPDSIAQLEQFIERHIFKTPKKRKKKNRQGKGSKTRRQQVRELVDAQDRDDRDRLLRFEHAISE